MWIKNIFFVLFLLTIFSRCNFIYKTLLNVKDPEIYKSRIDSHLIIKKDIGKKGLDENSIILYRSEKYLKKIKDSSVYNRNVKIFNSKGQLPNYSESVELCETYDMKYTAFSKGDYSLDSIVWYKNDSLSKYLESLETIDSIDCRFDYSSFDYIVLMDYSTFSKGPQNRAIRRLNRKSTFNNTDDVFYIFINKDIIKDDYYWEYKISDSTKQRSSR